MHAFFAELVVLISFHSNDLLLALQSRAGSSSARLECLLWEQEVVSSNLAYPTKSSAKLHKKNDIRKRICHFSYLQVYYLSLFRYFYAPESGLIEMVFVRLGRFFLSMYHKDASYTFHLQRAGEVFYHFLPVSMAGESGTDLKYPKVNSVIEKLYFIDTGAFLLDCYKANGKLSQYDHYYRIFSCDTLKSTRIDCADSTLVYRYCSPSFSSGNVKTYGQIFTDGGKLMMYTETSGTISGWTEDQVFRWDILDTRTLARSTVADNIKGIRPCSTLAEGLCFCTDQCFYNTSGRPVIDLSEYTIDMWENGNICFDGGSCTFEAKNNLGTRFQITIDTSGAVLSERAA